MTSTQSDTEATRAVVGEMYDAITRRDFAAVLGLMADDLVVSEPSYLPYGGEYRGLDQFQSLIGKAVQHLDVAKIEIDRVVVDGDRAIAILQIPTLAGGEHTVIAEESLVRHGKIAEMRIYFHETQGLHRS
jgi:ketosteroid isomerase-like protein